MKTISIRNGNTEKNPVVLLEFPFDHQLIDLVKTIPHAVWQAKRRAWAVPYSDTLLRDLLTLFKGKAWLDYTGFRRVRVKPESAPILLPDLSEAHSQDSRTFADWLRSRR